MSLTSFCDIVISYVQEPLLKTFTSIRHVRAPLHAPVLRELFFQLSLALLHFTFAMQSGILTLFDSVANMLNKLSGQPESYEKKYHPHFCF